MAAEAHLATVPAARAPVEVVMLVVFVMFVVMFEVSMSHDATPFKG